ncbi:MAG TPA: hypothetical protein VIJ94_04230 [Caulobacteraceae bacterium]
MRIYVSDGQYDFEGTVDDDADLDGAFTLTDDETGERFVIHGWLASELEILEG